MDSDGDWGVVSGDRRLYPISSLEWFGARWVQNQLSVYQILLILSGKFEEAGTAVASLSMTSNRKDWMWMDALDALDELAYPKILIATLPALN